MEKFDADKYRRSLRLCWLLMMALSVGALALCVINLVMLFVEVPLLDPILSVCISIYILYNVVHNLIVAFRIVLEGLPADVDYATLKGEIAALPDVAELSELRVWSLDNEHHAAEVHLTTSLARLDEVEALKKSLRALLERHGVTMSTIEVNP